MNRLMAISGKSAKLGKRTKIVCTIGPASASPKTLAAMVESGMNVARLNFSHGDYQNHEQLIRNIRKVSGKLKTPIAIMQDLQGPKIRVAALKKPLDAKLGQKLVIGQDFNLDFDVSQSLRPRQTILIEDGLIELEVEKIVGKKIYCLVIAPGKIQGHKGVNLPRSHVKFPILTAKDIADLKFGLNRDVDYVALSFVRGAHDVINLKNLIKRFNPKSFEAPKVIAKIEKPEAVKSFDKILKAADGIMVARGDLGVEVADSQVPIIQKQLIQKCLQAAKPVIVATQMLDSMIRNPRPTRAEVSDVANAVIDQTDAVMLSGETAFGRYPVKAVAEMRKIIEATEKSVFLPEHRHLAEKIVSRPEAISESAYDLAAHTKAALIIGATASGFTAREVVHKRPYHAGVVMFTPKSKVLRQMCLLWGVQSFLVPEAKSLEELTRRMFSLIKKYRLAKKGDKVVLVTGEPLSQKESLNLVEEKTL